MNTNVDLKDWHLWEFTRILNYFYCFVFICVSSDNPSWSRLNCDVRGGVSHRRSNVGSNAFNSDWSVASAWPKATNHGWMRAMEAEHLNLEREREARWRQVKNGAVLSPAVAEKTKEKWQRVGWLCASGSLDWAAGSGNETCFGGLIETLQPSRCSGYITESIDKTKPDNGLWYQYRLELKPFFCLQWV